jgi:hypothetical protein
VVGGGSGPSAIYYNPASISEVKASKLSLNASLFSFDFINARNALGEEINIKMSRGNIEPRFISYMLKSKRFKNWSFEIAVLNNENLKAENTEGVDQQIDILTGLPGEERYFADTINMEVLSGMTGSAPADRCGLTTGFAWARACL